MMHAFRRAGLPSAVSIGPAVFMLLAAAPHATAQECRKGLFGKDMCAEAETARIQIRPVLPRTLAGGMTWETIAASGPRLIGTIVWNVTAEQLEKSLAARNIPRSQIDEELTAFSKTVVCDQPLFKDFIADGGIFQFDFNSSDGKRITSVPLDQCN